MSNWVKCSTIDLKRLVVGKSILRFSQLSRKWSYSGLCLGYASAFIKGPDNNNDDGWYPSNIEVDESTLAPVLPSIPWIGTADEALKIFGDRLIGGTFSFKPDWTSSFDDGIWPIEHIGRWPNGGEHSHKFGSLGPGRGVPRFKDWDLRRITILTLGQVVDKPVDKPASPGLGEQLGPKYCCKRQERVEAGKLIGQIVTEHSLSCSRRADRLPHGEKAHEGAHGAAPKTGIKPDRRIRSRYDFVMVNQADLEDLLFRDE